MELVDFPDGGMWDTCVNCNRSLEECTCFGNIAPLPMPMYPVGAHFETLYRPAEQPVVSDPHQVQEDAVLQFQTQTYMHETDMDALFAAAIESFNDDATSIQPGTVQAHVDAAYLPGDHCLAEEAAAMAAATTEAAPGLERANRQVHTSVQQRARPRSQRQKRQAPIPNGFPCEESNCTAIFDRKCDLNRHKKKHLSNSNRPYKCDFCDQRFVYPKDCERHQKTHPSAASAHALFYCRAPRCPNEGFKRADNRTRHERKQHPELVLGF